MGFFFTAIIVAMFLTVDCVRAEEKKAPPDSSMETKLPTSPLPDLTQTVSLDDAIKQVSQEGKNKILAAKTELIDGKKIYLIKILTAAGHIQYIRIDASTGKTLEKEPK